MDSKFSLNPDDLQVQSFVVASTSDTERLQPAGDSWPAMCTCINICQPTQDIYCSGGCPPETTIVVVEY
jgi:hypothetical protein